ncbi:MAG: NFACT RNA binding domain-containing protein [Fusobacteriaceae bacterium]|jgi:predicted ribosome quality control (RQC) complex YloA/Tae2 family protein|nr:NFACT RNA binding domain-containing protein [Fusobacteriaceae bacterium]
MIYEEIADQGLIREKENVFTKKNKGKGRRRTPVISCGELSWGSLTILYGRNNLENDCLTFRTAGKEDIWLHSKYVPGAHVVLRADPGKEITEAGILAGAKVAAWFTAANPGEKITVDYTKRKYVNKPKGGKPGFVTYTHEKALLVEKPSALPSEL